MRVSFPGIPLRRFMAACVALSVTLVGGGDLSAQDVAVRAERAGLPLPAAYYERLRSDPGAYSFTRALFRRAARADGVGAAMAEGVAGTVRLPVVLALFSDSPVPHITREMVQASLFDGPAQRGTLTQAYLDMSQGALAVGGEVLPWVRTGQALADVVGASQGLGFDGAVGPFFRDALDSLDATVDWSLYDNDGPDGVANSGDDDGFVDVVTFEQLEVEGSCGGPGIWPHRWTLSARLGAPYVTDDIGAGGSAIRINDYVTQGATDCSGAVVQDASTMAHELGHAFGLPDYYHWLDVSAGPRGRRWVLGCWELMAAGSWGCGPIVDPRPAFGPTHLSAHSKHRLGWIDYMEPGEVWNEEILLDPVQTSALALRIPLDAEGHEFLIAEYRDRVGFDVELPAAGVLFYKQDLRASYAPNPNGTQPYFLTLLERDGDAGLLRTDPEGGDRGVAGDAWGVAGSVHELHAFTAPPLRRSDGTATSVTVHEVSVIGGRARLVVSTSTSPRLVAPEGAPSLPTAVRVAGGVMPYATTWAGPSGVSVATEGDGVVIAGSPSGPLDLVLGVRDANGTATDLLALTPTGFAPWIPEAEELAAPLLGAEALTDARRRYLDQVGNGNGVYDVGDFRSWLRGGP